MSDRRRFLGLSSLLFVAPALLAGKKEGQNGEDSEMKKAQKKIDQTLERIRNARKNPRPDQKQIMDDLRKDPAKAAELKTKRDELERNLQRLRAQIAEQQQRLKDRQR